MTIRFLTVWNGYQPGSVATLDGDLETALIAGHIARSSAVNDNVSASDLQSQINALDAAIEGAADTYADDAAAATGGVAVGGLYNTAGAVKVRLA